MNMNTRNLRSARLWEPGIQQVICWSFDKDTITASDSAPGNVQSLSAAPAKVWTASAQIDDGITPSRPTHVVMFPRWIPRVYQNVNQTSFWSFSPQSVMEGEDEFLFCTLWWLCQTDELEIFGERRMLILPSLKTTTNLLPFRFQIKNCSGVKISEKQWFLTLCCLFLPLCRSFMEPELSN